MGIEIIFFWMVVGYAVDRVIKDGLELPFTLRGKAPPSHERRMEKLRQQRSKAGQSMPRGGGPGRYFAGILDESISRANKRRANRTKVWEARHAVRTGHRVNQVAEAERARLARKADRRANRKRPWTRDPDQTEGGPTPTDLSEFDKFPETGPDGGPTDRPTPRIVPRLVKTAPDPEPEEEPEPESTGRHAAPEVEPSNVTTLPVAEEAPAGEAGSLTQSIDQAKAWEHVLAAARNNIGTMGHLLKAHNVDGPPLEKMATLWELFSSAVVEMGECRAALESRLLPQESLTNIEGKPGDTGWLAPQTQQTSQAG